MNATDVDGQTLIQGDALEVLRDMRGNQFRACVTDPPYGIAFGDDDIKNTIRESGQNRMISANWDKFESPEAFRTFTADWLKRLHRVMSMKSNVFMFFSYTHRDWIIQVIKDAGFTYRKPLIFYKPDTMGVFPNNFGCNFEDIYWFVKNEDSVEEKYYIKIPADMRDVITAHSTNNAYRKECGFHPTAKPYKMIEQLVRICTRPGERVIDPFLGSGTTLVACRRLGRLGTGIEINPEYCAVAERRIRNAGILAQHAARRLGDFAQKGVIQP